MGDGKDGAVIAKESKISCRNEFRKRSSTASHSRGMHDIYLNLLLNKRPMELCLRFKQ